MIYHVRWRSANDDKEYTSRIHLSTTEAADFACTLFDHMVVADVWIVDGGGQRVMMMPEITRHCRLRKEH